MIGVKELVLPTVVFILLWILLLSMRGEKYVFYGVSLLSVILLSGGSAIFWITIWMPRLITNKGVIDLEWKGWFHRTSARILYSDIEAASYEIKGIMPTLCASAPLTRKNFHRQRSEHST